MEHDINLGAVFLLKACEKRGCDPHIFAAIGAATVSNDGTVSFDDFGSEVWRWSFGGKTELAARAEAKQLYLHGIIEQAAAGLFSAA